MSPAFDCSLVRASIFAVGAAQGLIWLYTLSMPRNGLAPLDLVVIWLTVPALFFGAQRDWEPLGAGLAAASLVIFSGLLI